MSSIICVNISEANEISPTFIKKIVSSKQHDDQFLAKVQNIAFFRRKWPKSLYLISDRNGSKTIPFSAAHSYKASGQMFHLACA